jgi:hypothetical protein
LKVKKIERLIRNFRGLKLRRREKKKGNKKKTSSMPN